jgi:anti-sigma B factor antagonist
MPDYTERPAFALPRFGEAGAHRQLSAGPRRAAPTNGESKGLDIMQISERSAGDVMIVDVSGKITLGDGGDVMLKDKMQSLIQQGKKKVLLNLGDVSYVDSAGLGEIVQAYATINKGGGALKLLNTTKRIKDLLSITKLLTVFECHDNETDAVKSFK